MAKGHLHWVASETNIGGSRMGKHKIYDRNAYIYIYISPPLTSITLVTRAADAFVC